MLLPSTEADVMTLLCQTLSISISITKPSYGNAEPSKRNRRESQKQTPSVDVPLGQVMLLIVTGEPNPNVYSLAVIGGQPVAPSTTTSEPLISIQAPTI